MNKYVERLYNEWCEHGKIIIAVDFDDTLKPHKGLVNDYSVRVIALLKQCQREGCYIVINTASDKLRYEAIVHYLTTFGLIINSINENPIKLPFGNYGKVYANIYLDDRAGLLEALDILEEALDMYKLYKQTKKKYA